MFVIDGHIRQILEMLIIKLFKLADYPQKDLKVRSVNMYRHAAKFANAGICMQEKSAKRDIRNIRRLSRSPFIARYHTHYTVSGHLLQPGEKWATAAEKHSEEQGTRSQTALASRSNQQCVARSRINSHLQQLPAKKST